MTKLEYQDIIKDFAKSLIEIAINLENYDEDSLSGFHEKEMKRIEDGIWNLNNYLI